MTRGGKTPNRWLSTYINHSAKREFPSSYNSRKHEKARPRRSPRWSEVPRGARARSWRRALWHALMARRRPSRLRSTRCASRRAHVVTIGARHCQYIILKPLLPRKLAGQPVNLNSPTVTPDGQTCRGRRHAGDDAARERATESKRHSERDRAPGPGVIALPRRRPEPSSVPPPSPQKGPPGPHHADISRRHGARRRACPQPGPAAPFYSRRCSSDAADLGCEHARRRVVLTSDTMAPLRP